MAGSLFLFVVFSLALGSCWADEIQQSPNSLSVRESESVEMSCVQTGTVRENVLWYRQTEGAGLALIGNVYSGLEPQYEKGFQSGFLISAEAGNKRFNFQIRSVRDGDEARYFCAAKEGTQRLREE
ncbi:novel immune-type receptor 2b [Leucoraja erinacea]|uniref:novel immune-type receptor 2b n=1 Tax=Leucoraja erinaceus TaxID=7782 RepID=UPI002453B294|nr:novel immune-type receptor 2b [Leucoraja erinacea]